MIRTSLNNFCKLPGFNWVLSMILMATSLPVGMCLANLTLAKFPFPMVFRSRYLPMCGSSPVLLPDILELGSPCGKRSCNASSMTYFMRTQTVAESDCYKVHLHWPGSNDHENKGPRSLPDNYIKMAGHAAQVMSIAPLFHSFSLPPWILFWYWIIRLKNVPKHKFVFPAPESALGCSENTSMKIYDF